MSPMAMEVRRIQSALLLKLVGILVPMIIAAAVTVYLQTDRNHQELMRQREAVSSHSEGPGHEGTRHQLNELMAEVRALRQEIAGRVAVQDQRWGEIDRRLNALERQRERRSAAARRR